MKKRFTFTLYPLVALSFLILSSCGEKDPLKILEQKHLSRLTKDSVVNGEKWDVAYDVKKTDSLATPYLAELNIKWEANKEDKAAYAVKLKNNTNEAISEAMVGMGPFNEYKVIMKWQDNQWQLGSVTVDTNFGDSPINKEEDLEKFKDVLGVD